MFSTTRNTDRRRGPRDPLNGSLSILCTNHEGRETVMHAQLLDISILGARLSILEKIPTHSVVTFYHHKFGIGGRGTVRFCRSGRKGYEVGLEFPNGTGWRPALRQQTELLADSIAGGWIGPQTSTPPTPTIIPSPSA
jgi:hypothetical protein